MCFGNAPFLFYTNDSIDNHLYRTILESCNDSIITTSTVEK